MSMFFNPPDVEEAYEAFSANCGPAAFAAVLRLPVMRVAPFFPSYPDKAWCNSTQMRDALSAAMDRVRSCGRVAITRDSPQPWPDYGLVLIQIEGPWEAPGVPFGAALRRTHWVGSAHTGKMLTDAERWIYDVNNFRWVPFAEWRDHMVPRLLEANKRSTGWRIRAAISVQLWGEEKRRG